MEKETVTTLLSGTGGPAPRLCRASLAGLMVLRLGFLILGAATVWRDESADLRCNSTQQSCLIACWDEAFPISPLNLFLLQAASLLTHSLACVFLYPSLDVQGKCLGGQSQPWGGGLELRLHLVNLLAKTLLEGLFVVTFHSLYSHYPETLYFPPSVSCPEATQCTIQAANWKAAFSLFIAATSWASIAVVVIALCLAIREMLQTTFSACKMSSIGTPLLRSVCSLPSKWDFMWKGSSSGVPV
ncbi:gap junction beta-7 protein-like [Ahaetulla prasina]|uniref:gap junction beta-7 protein-like n=1 Tax=Ahaetulla prasina TaxID=499056 RepID=UPI0026495623|nr:gap junction beta-7 protein-like [Ahaetulla prasina]